MMSGISSEEWFGGGICNPELHENPPVDESYPKPIPKPELTEEEIKRMWDAVRECSQ
jgi:hypothetical protein